MSQQTPKVEFITERSTLVAGRDETVDVLIRITPPDADAGAARRRPRLNLGIVLDRSGSMEGAKMERAREATTYCIDQLLPDDRISVVIFDDHIDVLIPSQRAVDKEFLKQQLAHVHARSATALHEAWVRGGIEVSEHLDGDCINRVLLITDGLANTGLTNTNQIVAQALGLSQRGVSTSTIGIGDDFNEDLLMPMAEAGRGNAWHVVQPDDMQRIFAVELEGLISQVAHTVTLGLVPSDGIRLADVLNDFEMNETGRYKLPNLQSGSPLDVAVQLRVPAQEAGARRHLLDLRLGYTPQDATAAEVVKHAFEIGFDGATAVEALPVRSEVAKAVQLMMNARARREAMTHMDRGDYARAREVVSASLCATMASPSFDVADQDFRRERASLENVLSTMDDRSQDKMRRKHLAYDSYSRRYSKKTT